MTQNEIRAKLELLASLASAAAKLELEIKDGIKTEKSQKVSSIVIRDVREGKNKNVDEVMRLLDELGHLSHLPEGEPIVTPFVNFTSAYFMDMGVRYPSGDELFASLGVSDGTYQVDLVYDAVNSKGEDAAANLALAEIKQGELAEMYGLSKDNMDVDVYTYEDVMRTDFTRKFSISHKEMERLLEKEEEREE